MTASRRRVTPDRWRLRCIMSSRTSRALQALRTERQRAEEPEPGGAGVAGARTRGVERDRQDVRRRQAGADRGPGGAVVPRDQDRLSDRRERVPERVEEDVLRRRRAGVDPDRPGLAAGG